MTRRVARELKTRSFSVSEYLIVMFKMLYYSLLLLISTIHDFLSFSIVVSKREEWKEHFYGRPRATLTSLRHCSRACGGILPCWFKV